MLIRNLYFILAGKECSIVNDVIPIYGNDVTSSYTYIYIQCCTNVVQSSY